MSEQKPTISLIILTYNRAHLVERAIDSALNQTFQDFEIILVDNGSTDNTPEVLKKYDNHEKIRKFHIKDNVGYKKAMNFGLDHIRGEWFTQLGDDDFIVEDAFEQLLNVPKTIDPEITAITCNALDTGSDMYAGRGLFEDQYLPLDVIVAKTDGVFWGLTKSELLKGNLRHKESLLGFEHLFWYQIDLNGSKRYYLHKPLKIYYTDHATETVRLQSQKGLMTKIGAFKDVVHEKFYFDLLYKHNPKKYAVECIRGMYYTKLGNHTEEFKQYKKMLVDKFPNFKNRTISGLLQISNSGLLNFIHQIKGRYSIKGMRGWYEPKSTNV